MGDAALLWRATADGQLYISVENNASSVDLFRPYGPNAKYAIIIHEYPHQMYLPAVNRDALEVATPTELPYP